MNHIKPRTGKTLQNNICLLSGHRDERINHITGEYNRLAQKEYKTRHDCMGMVIPWELWKKTEVWPYEQMVCAQLWICPGE